MIWRFSDTKGFQGRDLKSDMTPYFPLGLPHRNKQGIPLESNYKVRQLIKGSRRFDLSHSLEWFATGPQRRKKKKKGGMKKEEERLNGRNSCPVTLIVLAVSDREEINMSLTICTSIHLSLRHMYVLMFAAAIRASCLPHLLQTPPLWAGNDAPALGATSHVFTGIFIVVCLIDLKSEGRKVCKPAAVLRLH